MPKMAARAVVVALALFASPLYAGNGLVPPPGARTTPSIGEALAALPQPLAEEAFFELINASGGPGYVVGSAQGGTQIMVIIVYLVIPGDAPVAVPVGISITQFHLDSFFGGFTLMDVTGTAAPPAGAGNLASGGRAGGAGAAAAGRGAAAGAGAAAAGRGAAAGAAAAGRGVASGGASGAASGSGAARGNNPSTTTPSGSGVPASGSVSARSGGNYRIEVDGLPTDIVTDVSWTSDGQLKLTIPMTEWDAWSKWYQTQLRSDSNADRGVNGTLEFLTPDQNTTTGSIDFFGMLPVSLQLLPTQANRVGSFVVTLHADTVRRTGNTTATPTNKPGAASRAARGAGRGISTGAGGAGTDTGVSGHEESFNYQVWESPELLADKVGDEFGEGVAVVGLPDDLIGDDPFDADFYVFELDQFDACTQDPSTPNCDAAGGVFANSLDLLNACSGADSPVCTRLLGDAPVEEGTYYLFVDGFGAAADEDFYRFTLSVDVALTCEAQPATPGCSEAGDLLYSLYAYDSGCGVNPGPACIDDALPPEGIPEEFLIDSNDVLEGPDSLGTLDESETPVRGTLGDLSGDEVDWYSFTLDNPPAVTLETAPTGTDDPALDTEVWLYDLDDFAACGENPATPNCGAAGEVFSSMSDLLGVCSETDSAPCDLFSAIGPGLLETGTYLVRIEYSYEDNVGPYTLTLDADQVAACAPDSDVPGCSELVDLVGGLYEFNSGCDADPSPVCNESALASDEADDQLSYLWELVGGSSTSAPREVIVSPGSAPGHIGFRETGDSTGIFRVSEEEMYTFDPNNPDILSAAFADLPEGSAIATDRYIIRPAPGAGGKYLFRDGGGKIYLLDGSELGPPSGIYPLTELTVDESASNETRTILTGPGATRIVIPAPGVTYVNVNENPEGIATTPDAIDATSRGGGTGLIGLVTSKGGSTGAVFDIRLLNMGKPALVEGDAIFEPLSAADADAVRNALSGLMGSVNSVFDTPGTGYCVEQDKTVPSAGDLFRFANAAKSAQFSYAQKVLAGARQVEGAGLLHPDSDPGDYTHSTRQWAIWTAEKGFDKEGFTDSFLEHTRDVLAANGTQWSSQIEDAVRGLIDNRWNDIRQVLDAAGIATADDDRALAAAGGSGSAGVTLGLLLAGLIAVAISHPGARAR